VNIVGRATGLGTFSNTPVGCAAAGCQSRQQPDFLSYRRLKSRCGPTGRAAYDYPGATPPEGAATLLAETAEAEPPPPARTVHRRRTRIV
jgi:hypothetical protein